MNAKRPGTVDLPAAQSREGRRNSCHDSASGPATRGGRAVIARCYRHRTTRGCSRLPPRRGCRGRIKEGIGPACIRIVSAIRGGRRARLFEDLGNRSIGRCPQVHVKISHPGMIRTAEGHLHLNVGQRCGHAAHRKGQV
jgi:hypothetical protein